MSNQPLKLTCQWHLVNLNIAFNVLDQLSHRTNPPSIRKIVQYDMVGAKISIEGVLSDFPTLILTNIIREPTKEGRIDLHRLVSGNESSVVLNLGRPSRTPLADNGRRVIQYIDRI